jgi:hypothetical protein
MNAALRTDAKQARSKVLMNCKGPDFAVASYQHCGVENKRKGKIRIAENR